MATATLDANRSCTIDIKDCQKVDGKLVATVQFATSHVTIISPSFGCPGVFEKDQDITLYVLADQLFLDTYLNDKQNNKNNLTEYAINYHLKITHTADTKECADKFMYAKGSASANIKCTYLDNLSAHTEDVRDVHGNVIPEFDPISGKPLSGNVGKYTAADIRIYDQQKKDEKTHKLNPNRKLVACLRESTRDYYITKGVEENGVIRPARPYLFRIDLNPATMQQPLSVDKFYECSWYVANLKPGIHSKEKICELQDLDCRQFVKGKSKTLHAKSTAFLPVKNGKVDFAATEDAPHVQFDDASPIQAYHPFIISSKPHLNIGQLSDVHISSRQVSFRKSTVRVLEGMSESPAIGELVNTTLESFSDMLKQMADDSTIDAIIITGDLIDYNHNFMPATEITGAGDLWDKMHHDKHQDEKLYPRFLDSLVIFSLLKSYYDKPDWKKPIFLVSGNHEHYQDIYGIAPRIGDALPGVSNKGIKRANPGVPADHNLTIYEACLMYGPDFGWYSKAVNFNKTYADWFYRIFTPLTDYRITFKDQSIAALGWGDDEAIMNLSALGSDTTLYRASKSVSDVQLELLNAAATAGSQRLICSHYPFASYDVSHCLKTEGEINCNDLLKEFDHFSQGTFKKNRSAVYKLMGDNKFHFTLSGHSHRAGIYAGDFKGGARPTYTVMGKEIPLVAAKLPADGRCKMVVSGCSGPVGVQNHYATTADKGLGGWGLDYPSGNHLTLAKGNETIKRIIPKTPAAKPRFAVALDYMDIIGREDDKHHHGVFTSIMSDPTGSTFTFTVNPDLPKECFIEKIEIVAYTGAKGQAYPMQVEWAGVLKVRLAEGDRRALAKKLTPKKGKEIQIMTFLHITFTKALAGIPGYTQYNYDTPWIYPIEIVDLKERQRELVRVWGNRGAGEIERAVSMVSGYELRRHPDCGEIPDHEWYSTTFGYGYDFNKNQKKKK